MATFDMYSSLNKFVDPKNKIKKKDNIKFCFLCHLLILTIGGAGGCPLIRVYSLIVSNTVFRSIWLVSSCLKLN